MAIEIGSVNADTSVKLGSTTIQSGYIGTNLFFGNQLLGVLDVYPTGIHHAYSLRRLRFAYGGFCLRVRRTTTTPTVTTTTVDLSFDTTTNAITLNSAITYVSGTATTAINLGQFCASVVNGYSNPDGVNTNQNIFVVTWFDQSGNGKNPTNATAGQQPRLINTGNLELSGGKVAVRFTKTSSQNLNIADATANINNMSSYWVGQFLSFTGTQIGYLLSPTTPNGRFYFPYNTANIAYASYGSTLTQLFYEVTPITRRLYELIAPDPEFGQVRGWNNGVQTGNTVTLRTQTISNIQIGTGTTNYFDGYIQEVIGYQSNSFRVEKESNINSYWTIY
jgi:hypothetical protein